MVGVVPEWFDIVLANTLDAMWGYRNERYMMFGWAAARLKLFACKINCIGLCAGRAISSSDQLLGGPEIYLGQM